MSNPSAPRRDGIAVQPAVPSDHWFRDLAEESGDLFFVIRTEPDLAIEFMSDTVETHLGFSTAEMMADPDLMARRIDARDAGRLARVLALPAGESVTLELRWVHRDGRPRWTQSWAVSRLREDGSVVLEGISHDTTEEREVEQMRALFEERYQLMAESANIVLWTMGLDGSITYVSPTVEQMRGFTPEEAMNQPLEEILTPESQLITQGYYAQLFVDMQEGRVPQPFRCEQEYLCKDGSTVWTEVEVIPYLNEEGVIVELLGITRDIRDRKRYLDELKASRDEVAQANAALQEVNEMLHRLAVTDPLTGVWNRRHAEEFLAHDVAERRRYGTPMSLLLLDVDHFKDINDSRGHQAGDSVLIEVTKRIMANLRSTDVLSRWGGEEFIILTRHCTQPEAMSIAEKMCALIADEPFGESGTVTVSIGVAELRPQDDVDSWLSRADAALYEAKAAGRNTSSAAQ